jgi:hypothetical protein
LRIVDFDCRSTIADRRLPIADRRLPIADFGLNPQSQIHQSKIQSAIRNPQY